MSSLINFLNPKFRPTVVTKAGCESGFTAANLIAYDADQLERGFMCLAACKPPVEIIFNFPKAVDMKVIKLWPTIRAQRSTAFELHGRQNDNWERVAFVKDLAHDAKSVTFCHQSEYNSQSSSNAGPAPFGQSQSEKVFFFKTAHKILASTNSVKVIIRATEEGPPVLRKVEMWGLPARSLEKADRELVTSLWSEISDNNGQRNASLANKLPPTLPPSPRPVFQLREQSTLSIPEEFLDCITWDLMVVPTVLPSGKVVDKSTIIKHAAAEAKWGRQPSDPFTSLEYNDQRKTTINMELKKRIDDFLMEHPGDFEEMPQPSKSSGVDPASSGFGRSSALGTDRLGPYVMTQVIPEFDTSFREQQHKRRSAGNLSSPSSKRTHQPGTLTGTSTSSASWLTISSSHQQQGSRLNGNSGSMASLIRCINCRSAQFRYKIRTCRHYVCVYCLVQLSGGQVCVCKVPFQDADVEPCYKGHR